MIGQESVNERPSYVIAIAPKTQNKYLVRGKIWVDLDDYAIARIEGERLILDLRTVFREEEEELAMALRRIS